MPYWQGGQRRASSLGTSKGILEHPDATTKHGDGIKDLSQIRAWLISGLQEFCGGPLGPFLERFEYHIQYSISRGPCTFVLRTRLLLVKLGSYYGLHNGTTYCYDACW